MNQVELLRHVADNLEAGLDEAHGLVKDGAAKDFQGVMLREPRLYSLAPRTRIINGAEVPAPMDKEPEVGSTYWCEAPASGACSFGKMWTGVPTDKMRFERGLCYDSVEAAEANCKARYGIK